MTASPVLEAARRARPAAVSLARLPAYARRAALEAAALAVARNAEAIAAANRRDLAAAERRMSEGGLSPALLKRLVLDQDRLRDVVAGMAAVADLPDPLGRVTLSVELDDGLRLTRVTCPIGVVGVIFESRPDALPQILSLCLMSGNGALLKGGSEAAGTNRALFDVIREAVRGAGVPAGCFELLESREDARELLGADGVVDLMIPRGSNALVRWVQENTRIPVLGHAEGLCHLYVDAAADLEKAVAIAMDAKVQYPAACNSIETLLVHEAVAGGFVPRIVKELRAVGAEVRGDPRTVALAGAEVRAAADSDWDTEYSDLVLSVRVVDGIGEAIAHINRHGSRHTEAIVTEDRAAAGRFLAEVDAAGVFHNASTRFADGFRYGFGAEVGISTGKLHPRGPVGVEGLVTYKYVVVGEGHVVSSYVGPAARRFTHRPLD